MSVSNPASLRREVRRRALHDTNLFSYPVETVDHNAVLLGDSKLLLPHGFKNSAVEF